MDKDTLPKYSLVDEHAIHHRRHRRRRRNVVRKLFACLIAYFIYTNLRRDTWSGASRPLEPSQAFSQLSTARLQNDFETCAKLRAAPSDPSGSREHSGRYTGGRPYLIKNATIWSGSPLKGSLQDDVRSGKAFSWVRGDVLLQHGLIKRVEAHISDNDLPDDCAVYDANGRQLTSGIVDMHSHAGVEPLPGLRGSGDGNELSGDITPFVRSIDGLNPLDPQIQNIKSGGVTTSLILPGSGNNMGGEAFVIKHAVGKPDGRTEISAEDMLADPDRHWRYMKMACGENPKSVYGRLGRDFGPFSRMGEAWYFRHAFEQASAMVSAQDDWCDAAATLGPEKMTSYLPQELKWESLGALLRGQVLLNTHCYTVEDLEAFVRHTNEFKFKVRAFHHAHQTYLVPEILKRAYGGRPPAAALFADNMYYKAEAYIGSEQAGKVLFENGITPVYVSDNPVINAQHVVFEAARAYKNGLPYHVALAGVTSGPAELLRLGERIGKVQPGFDGDVVVWDSDPLAVGATPLQVWIDGVPQFESPTDLDKPVRQPLEHREYLADIKNRVNEQSDIVFTGIVKVLLPSHEKTSSASSPMNAVVQGGKITCLGVCTSEVSNARANDISTIPLQNGHIAPPLTAFGSSLGLGEIDLEQVTRDGYNTDSTFSRAIDGLALDNKQLYAVYSHGVTRAISPPEFLYGGQKGISAGYMTAAKHTQEKGAVFADEVALHYTLTKSDGAPSLSAAVGQLRAKLLAAVNRYESQIKTPEEKALHSVITGKMPLVISTHSADIIAALIRVKSDIEAVASPPGTKLNLIIFGAAESHLLAPALAEADVAVILDQVQTVGATWDTRRALTGAPVTNDTAVDVLHAAGVRVAIGTAVGPEAQLGPRNLYLQAGIAHVNSRGKISEKEALALVSGRIYEILGLEMKGSGGSGGDGGVEEFVVFEGSPLEIDGQIRAVADGRGSVSVFV